MRLNKQQTKTILNNAHFLTVDGALHIVERKPWHPTMPADAICLLARHGMTAKQVTITLGQLQAARVRTVDPIHVQPDRPTCWLVLEDGRHLEFYVRKPLNFVKT